MVAERLVEHRLAPEPADHDRRGDLAPAEPGDLHLAPEIARGLRDAPLNLFGRHHGFEPDARLGELGDVCLDAWHEQQTIAWPRCFKAWQDSC